MLVAHQIVGLLPAASVEGHADYNCKDDTTQHTAGVLNKRNLTRRV